MNLTYPSNRVIDTIGGMLSLVTVPIIKNGGMNNAEYREAWL